MRYRSGNVFAAVMLITVYFFFADALRMPVNTPSHLAREIISAYFCYVTLKLRFRQQNTGRIQKTACNKKWLPSACMPLRCRVRKPR